MWHGCAECLSRQPCTQLCWTVAALCSSWLESAEPQRKVMSVERSWSSTLDVGFICKCVLPAQRPFLFRKFRTRSTPWEQHLWYVPYRPDTTASWRWTSNVRNVSSLWTLIRCKWKWIAYQVGCVYYVIFLVLGTNWRSYTIVATILFGRSVKPTYILVTRVRMNIWQRGSPYMIGRFLCMMQ
jgi:hypothetical protein